MILSITAPFNLQKGNIQNVNKKFKEIMLNEGENSLIF